MRTVVLMLCMALMGGLVNTAMAQNAPKEKPTAEERAQKRSEKLAQTLGLDATQKQKVYDLVMDQANKMEEINNTRLTQDERHAQMKELRSNFDEQLGSILTKDQYAKYQAKKEEMKQQKGKGQGGHHHGNCPDKKK